MKKILSITMLALLVAGAATLVVADTEWEGDATGNCGGHPVLVDWEGNLQDNPQWFDGYWGGKELNLMVGAWTQRNPACKWVNSGYWNTGGESYSYYGAWNGCFYPASDTASGSWLGTNISCNGTWAGHLKP